MDVPSRPPPAGVKLLRWFPEFLQLGQKRVRAQVRLLGLAILVGVVAGLGAIVFYVATRAAEHCALGVVAGYDPQPRPAGEVAPFVASAHQSSALSLAAAGDSHGGRAA